MTQKIYNVSVSDFQKDESVKKKEIENVSVTVENKNDHLWTLEEVFNVIGKKSFKRFSIQKKD